MNMLNKKMVKQMLSTFLAVCMVISLVLTAKPTAFTVNAVTEPVLLENSDEVNYEKLTSMERYRKTGIPPLIKQSG